MGPVLGDKGYDGGAYTVWLTISLLITLWNCHLLALVLIG